MADVSSSRKATCISFFERQHFFILTIVLFFALFFRTYDLSDNPPGLYIDEASSAYNAYSIIKTGMDEHGVSFPLFFEAFGEYRHGLYVYSMIPSIAVFGLNDFGTRFTSVVFGMLSLIVFYYFVRKLFDTNTALLAVLFLSLQPWHMHLSRVAFEGISFVFLFLAGLLCFHKGFERRKWFFVSTAFFGLCLHSYGVAKLFVPLFVLGLLAIYRHELFQKEMRKSMFFCAVLFLLLAAPIYYLSFFSDANARFQQGSIFVLSEHPFFTFFTNYASHYSPTFLFFSGDAGLRHHLSLWGLMYYFEIVLFFFALLFLWKKRSEKQIQMLFLWFILFAFPASFMYGDTPHALRTFIGAPLFALLSTLGLFYVWTIFAQNYHTISFLKSFSRERVCTFFCCVVAVILLVHVSFFVHEYFVEYKIYSYDYWMAYNEQMLAYTEGVRDSYNHIYFSANSMDRIYVYILYYLQTDPATYQRFGFENATGYDICDINSCFNESEHNLYVFRAFELKIINGSHQIYYPDNKTIAVKFVG